MKKVYLEPSVQIYKLNVANGILLATSSIPVIPGEEGGAASRMNLGNGMDSPSKSIDLWNEGW